MGLTLNEIRMTSKGQSRQITLKQQNPDSPKESPKSTVKIAPIDKSKGVEVASLFDHCNTHNSEFNSFKEEMRSMLKDMNQTI